MTEHPDIRTIFWDMGGVYVTDNVKPAYAKHGIAYDDGQRWPWRLCRLGKIGIRACFARGVYAARHASLTPKELNTLVDEILADAHALIDWQPEGAASLIRTLKATHPHIRHGVLSNHARDWADHLRKKFDLEAHFDPNLTLFSAEIGLDKTATDPCVYLYAAECANTDGIRPVTPDNLLLFDNEPDNVAMARKAGWHAEVFTAREAAVRTLRERYHLDL